MTFLAITANHGRNVGQSNKVRFSINIYAVTLLFICFLGCDMNSTPAISKSNGVNGDLEMVEFYQPGITICAVRIDGASKNIIQYRWLQIDLSSIGHSRLSRWGILINNRSDVVPISELTMDMLVEYGKWYRKTSSDPYSPGWKSINPRGESIGRGEIGVEINSGMYRIDLADGKIIRMTTGVSPFFNAKHLPILVDMSTNERHVFPYSQDVVEGLFGKPVRMREYTNHGPL